MGAPPNYKYHRFNLTVLSWMLLWQGNKITSSKWKDWKNYFTIVTTLPTTVPITYDIILMCFEPDVTLVVILSSVLALVCIIAEYYMVICFMIKREKIQQLVLQLADFEYYSLEGIQNTERKVHLLSKVVYTYSLIGSIIYSTSPMFFTEFCESTRTEQAREPFGVPCGIVLRMRFIGIPYNTTWFRHLANMQQAYLVVVITTVIINLTLLICSNLIHICNQLKQLRQRISDLNGFPEEEFQKGLVYCIEYHIKIANFCENMNDAFGLQIILHVTLTSFLISVIIFLILLIDMFTEIVRYTMHLCGWILILFMMCYFGQDLIDESESVADELYNIDWYNQLPKRQKDMSFVIARSQKPLALKAMSLGAISKKSFVSILSSAYTYFTLLLEMMKERD